MLFGVKPYYTEYLLGIASLLRVVLRIGILLGLVQKLVFPAKPCENYRLSKIMFREIMEVILNLLRILCRGSSGFVCLGSTNIKFF